MDAIKFINERNRMCRSFGDKCEWCPAIGNLKSGIYCAVHQKSMMDATSQIAIVEKWSAAHKTRQDVFLEQWPSAEISETGILTMCPKLISSDYRKKYGVCMNRICSKCLHEFWTQEAE